MSPLSKLSPLTILAIVMFLAVGELAAGTAVSFVVCVSLTILAVCITYNLLGGARTISGLGFTSFALNTIVISQFGKVLTFHPADQYLRSPQLTIEVYTVFFLSMMGGTFLMGRLRFHLPKPAEPVSFVEFRLLYLLSLIGGLAGSLTFAGLNLAGPEAQHSTAHGVARALSYLLPFALVIAVDEQIRLSGGTRSFSVKAAIPALGMMLIGFVGAARGSFVQPILLYFLTGYLRGYRFHRQHFLFLAGALAIFVLFLSPFDLYARGIVRSEATFRDEALAVLRELQAAPGQWQNIKRTAAEALSGGEDLETYFREPGLLVLNRLALISVDSTLIDACSNNYHYGFKTLSLDFHEQLPRFIDKNKPDYGTEEFLGHLDGQESDAFDTTFSTITPIAECFGAFSWLGAVIFPFFVMPILFVIFESVFDITKPWGTVAVVTLSSGVLAGSMGVFIFGLMIRTPIYLVVISSVVLWIVRLIPYSGDRALPRDSTDDLAGGMEGQLPESAS